MDMVSSSELSEEDRRSVLLQSQPHPSSEATTLRERQVGGARRPSLDAESEVDECPQRCKLPVAHGMALSNLVC